jgi:hypothetical protein
LTRTASIAAAALLALHTACSPRLGQAGRSDVAAAYSMGTLTTELGPEVSILAVSAAAERALRARGYAVEESRATEDRARLIAARAGHGPFEKAIVESWVTHRGTAVAVRIDPFGDEPASYAIMDDLLSRLGR